MTAGTAPPRSETDETRKQPPWTESESFIERRLRQTRRQIKSVDVWIGLVTLAAGTLAYLLVAALADHWLVPGGLGFLGRLLLFAILVIAGGTYLAIRLVPLAIRRVNPVFAAHSIEQSRPSLKNSLINFLFLRRERDQIERDRLATGIYHALERKAAADLEQIPTDVAVDRSQLIRLGYVLAAILAVCCLYLVASPKSPLVSFRRIIWPWADIKAPTRVTIENVEPGDELVYQGEIVHVSAEVDGLADDERVMLYYSTDDGQSVDQAIPMTLAEERSHHSADLPPGRFGLQQDVEYYLVAGDCRTRRFRLDVQTALSIVVDRVEYDYPDYTGIPNRIDERVADLKAIEGTRVTIRATANQEIGRAAVELDCDPRHALRMTVGGPKTAEAGFALMMDRNDPGRAEYESYQLRFTDTGGRDNQTPVRHRIEVIPDLPPEIRFVDPPPTECELPEDAVLELRVRAVDPDFALRRVALRAEHDQRSLSIPALLDKQRPEPPHEGPFQTTYRFEPGEFDLEAGDKVIYWAEAEDNMGWEDDVRDARLGSHDARRWPNRAETARRWITIVPPKGRSTPPSRPEQPQQPSEQTPPQPVPEETQKKQDQPPIEPQEEGQPDDEGQPGEKQQEQGPAGQQPGQGEQTGEGEQSGQGEQTGQGQSEQGGEQSSGRKQPGEEGQAGQSGESGAEQQSQNSGEGSGQEGMGQEGKAQQGKGQQASGQGPAGQQPGAPSSGEPGSSSEPVDGQTNPGDAFEKILRHLDEKRRSDGASSPAAKPGEQQGEQQGVAQQESGEPGSSSGQPAKQQPDGGKAPQATESQPQPAAQPQPGQGADQPDADRGGQGERAGQPSDDRQSTGEQQPGGEDQAPPDSGKPPQGEAGSSGGKQGDEQRMPDNDPGASQSPSSSPEPEAGQGAQAKGPGEPTQEESSGQSRENPDAQGGDPQENKGQGGAGKPSGEDQGSPSPQEANQQRKKQPGEGDQSEPREGESAQSPTTSPKDSDSQGDTSGDRSGGGEQGGGQKSEQSGTGTAGTHTASEQGGSQSDEQGEGPTGPDAGDQVQADRPTGRPADQGEGPGSGERSRPGGQPGEGDSQDRQSGSSSDDGSDSQQPADAGTQGPGHPKGHGPSGTPGTGRGPDREQSKPPPGEPGTYRREAPNLDFARQRTNLALEYLEDQLAKDQPDQGLLDRLGWTKEDLKRFYEQWNRMRQEGARSDSARTELDGALDSLGLRPPGTQFRGGRAETDGLERLREGLRSDPPPERADAYRAYRRGVSGRDP